MSAILELNQRAFGGSEEAEIVSALRAAGAVTLSLVTEDEVGRIVGHILFSPVTVATPGGESVDGIGLGPMAVLPESQRQGVGGTLVRAGLERLTQAGHRFVVVLGHSSYYTKHGFVPASRHRLRWERLAPDEAFMVRELCRGGLASISGIVRYHPCFG